jgi:hypothetical protein
MGGRTTGPRRETIDAANRFELRKQLVVQEANTIGTAYLRTDFADEPQRRAPRR